jgi:hypothetical protein
MVNLDKLILEMMCFRSGNATSGTTSKHSFIIYPSPVGFTHFGEMSETM